MVKVIFFDFWGTLVENGIFPSPVRQVKSILNLYRTPFPLFIVKFEEAFMTREYNDLYEAFSAVCEAFNIRPTPVMLDRLVGMWNKNKLLAKPYPETLKVLQTLKKKYKIVLISNTDCFSIKSVVEKFELDKYFDLMVFSYDTGMLKSNPKAFENALKKLKLKKEDVIMVGDSMESDIQGAKNAGIDAVLIDRRDRREFENKIVTLDELEKLLK
ncbi:HAD family hydrolase [Candidatus Woesearchaeota archaeon]|nr:HAD family hydrolase [Candidatus Woesearchaeota archaeon]